MKLLIFTQAMDRGDSTISVFHDWLLALAKKFEKVTIICLKKGDYSVPDNVTVISLGKERGVSHLGYVMNFYRNIITLRETYGAVFVHMNQEYVLLGGLFWRLWGKKVYMWRNHHAGSLLTDIAAFFCTHVFCTSKFSYTAKYKKTIIMPVGIDTEVFKEIPETERQHNSILFLARIAPVKKLHVLIEALTRLSQKGITFTAHIYGDPLPKDVLYYESLKKSVVDNSLSDKVYFYKGVPNTDTVRVYNEHEIFVNLSSSGMYDKTIFEAMACESLVVASNRNLEGLIADEYICTEDDVKDIALKLEGVLALSGNEKEERGRVLRGVVLEHHSLASLAEKVKTIIF